MHCEGGCETVFGLTSNNALMIRANLEEYVDERTHSVSPLRVGCECVAALLAVKAISATAAMLMGMANRGIDYGCIVVAIAWCVLRVNTTLGDNEQTKCS